MRIPAGTDDVKMRPKSKGTIMWLLVLLYALALGLSLVLVFKGRYELGVTGVLLVLTMSPVSFVLAMTLTDPAQRLLASKMDELVRSVRMLGDQAALSDDARRVLNRQGERDLLRLAIEEDINNQHWDAAMVLVKELADRFGFRIDAEEFRQRIDSARAATLEAQVADAVGYLDGLIIQRRWDEAAADAARIQRLYPDSPRVEALRARVAHARGSYKSEIERQFLVASQEGRADDALALLKDLDQHLSPSEAEPLRELARGVIGKARENLGAKFKLAVQDRRWREAAELGEQIVRDFPNTRMAAEVREVIDGVRSRAAGSVATTG